MKAASAINVESSIHDDGAGGRPLGERALCAAVIRAAVHDLTSASVNVAARDHSSARRFFFDADSPFVWMAGGLGLSIGATRSRLRSALRERGPLIAARERRFARIERWRMDAEQFHRRIGDGS